MAVPPVSVLHVLPHPGGGAETYVDLLEAMEGVRHERVALAAARTPLAAGPSIVARWSGIAHRAARADLVHAHGDVAAALGLPFLRRGPAVWTTHGLHFLRRARGAAGTAARRAVRATVAGTACTICTSEAERMELAALVGAPLADRLRTVRNGIPLPPATDPAERARARQALGLRAEEVAALFVGELEERKRPLLAAAAAQQARANGAPLVLLVAGDGPQAAALEKRAGAAVRPLGFRDDVPRLLAACDVFVLPSEREGLSFAVLEAMGCGLAPVVSDGAGNPEAVGNAGVVVPAGDAAALARALERLARDPSARARLSAAARERVARELSADALVLGVRAAYDRALDGAPG